MSAEGTTVDSFGRVVRQDAAGGDLSRYEEANAQPRESRFSSRAPGDRDSRGGDREHNHNHNQNYNSNQRGHEGNHHRDNYRNGEPRFQGRGGGGRGYGGNNYSNSNNGPSPSAAHRGGYDNGGYRGRGSYGHGHGGGGGGFGGGGRGFGGGGGGPRRGFPPPPMRSFRNFVVDNRDVDHLTSAQRYEEYQVSSVAAFSDAFFEHSCKEEWFRERYDPLRQRELEAETASWAQRQSLAFVTQFLRPVEAEATDAQGGGMVDEATLMRLVRAVRLGPEDATATASSLAAATEPTVAEEETVVSRLLPGHARRTIYVTGIPASCPRPVFRATVMQALQPLELQAPNLPAAGDAPPVSVPNTLVDRVLVSQPAWNKAGKFERSAWVVVADGAHVSVMEVLQALRAAGEVAVPGPVNPATGDVNLRHYTFIPTYVLHSQRITVGVPQNQNVSGSGRVQSDELAARRLANLLDEMRRVPVVQSLHQLLTDVIEPNTTTTLVAGSEGAAGSKPVLLPTDVLDLSIAYLRSVHFVCFYEGRRFIDEAALLSQVPGAMRRAHPFYIFVRNNRDGKSPAAEGASADGAAAGAAAGGKRSRDEAEATDEAVAGAEDGEVDGDAEEEAAEEEAAEAAADKAAEAEAACVPAAEKAAMASSEMTHPALPDLSSPRTPRIMYIAKPVEHMLQTLHQRAYGRLARMLCPQPEAEAAPAEDSEEAAAPARRSNDRFRDVDEEDADAIAAEVERVLSAWSEGLVSVEKPEKPEGAAPAAAPRARCGLKWCNKLFKGPDFVKKHVRSKHEDLAADQVLAVVRPYMQRRFEAEGVFVRPLPAMPVEGSVGVEYRSVQEVLDGCPQAGNLAIVGLRPKGLRPSNNDRCRDRDGRQWDNRGSQDGRGGNHRNGDGGHKRDREGGFVPPPAAAAPRRAAPEAPAAPFVHPNPGNRQLSLYKDVDAPQVAVSAIDYGNLMLPPPKKKKLGRGSLGGASSGPSTPAAGGAADA